MKLTRHNGRARQYIAGKNGVYNPKHNDRRFDIENSEHIDADRANQNIYWDCYTGFSSAKIREQDKKMSTLLKRLNSFTTLNITQTTYRRRMSGTRKQDTPSAIGQ